LLLILTKNKPTKQTTKPFGKNKDDSSCAELHIKCLQSRHSMAPMTMTLTIHTTTCPSPCFIFVAALEINKNSSIHPSSNQQQISVLSTTMKLLVATRVIYAFIAFAGAVCADNKTIKTKTNTATTNDNKEVNLSVEGTALKKRSDPGEQASGASKEQCPQGAAMTFRP
jgi:hypothetical protein